MPAPYVAEILASSVNEFVATYKNCLKEIYLVDIGCTMVNLIQKQLEQQTNLIKVKTYQGKDPNMDFWK